MTGPGVAAQATSAGTAAVDTEVTEGVVAAGSETDEVVVDSSQDENLLTVPGENLLAAQGLQGALEKWQAQKLQQS